MVASSIGLTVSRMAPLLGDQSSPNGPPYGRAPPRRSWVTSKYPVQCGVKYPLRSIPSFFRVTPSVCTGVAADTAATCADVLSPGVNERGKVNALLPTPFQICFE